MASLTLSATFLPCATLAAARRSSIREFVHEPMKIRSSVMSDMAVPAAQEPIGPAQERQLEVTGKQVERPTPEAAVLACDAVEP